MSNDDGVFSAKSSSGDIQEALKGAITAARAATQSNFLTWRLQDISGSVGGFMGAHDVVVAIRAAVPGREAMLAATAENAGRCGEWYAWHDRMPGKRPTLHVIGSCTFTTGGYEVELRRPDSEGFNPVIRILEKHVRPPTGQAVDVISVVPVHYTEETEAPYTHVQITPDNVLVPVREVF